MSASQSTTILFLVQVITDVELLAPIVAEARRRPGVRVRVLVVAKAFRRTPELRSILDAAIPGWETSDEDEIESGATPQLDGVNAVFAATESSAAPHRAAHALARRANRLGLRSYTMQHGYESVGLTWFDADYPPGSIGFESRTIFTWGPIERLHHDVSPATRAQCLPVGCSRVERPTTLPRPGARPRLLAIFENLHWSRYSDDFRARFLAHLAAAARAHCDTTFLVRPHPRGKWLTHRCKSPLPTLDNVVIASSAEERWVPYDAAALIDLADGVITTPSTIAINAALRGKPTAIVANGLDLAPYAPLPLLQQERDWLDFAAEVVSPRRPELVRLVERFASTSVLPGDGTARMVDRVLADVAADATNGAAGERSANAAAAAGAAGAWRRLTSRLRAR